MLKNRLIPVLILQNGLLVRSEGFKTHQVLGNPLHEVERFNAWNVDELIYLDISRDKTYDLRRDDQKVKDLADPLEILRAVSKTCFMPLTWGGGLRSVEDMRRCLQNGADKISVNTAAAANPSLITEAAKAFGSQAVVVSIDCVRLGDGWEVMTEGGRTATGRAPVEWAKEAEDRGAGEILLQSIERDGSAKGYDLELLRAVTGVTSIPVIACSGVGKYEHFAEGIQEGASAVSAANIFHFKELSDRNAKRVMKSQGVNVR